MRYTRRDYRYNEERDTHKFYLFPRKKRYFGSYSSMNLEVRFWEWTMVRQQYDGSGWSSQSWSPTDTVQTYPFWYAPFAVAGKTAIRYLKNVVLSPYYLYRWVRLLIAARKAK